MRLNLGCGDDIRPDYLNVDFRETSPHTKVVDLSKLPWPFADASADEVMMLDFVEHFPIAHTHAILTESHRILRRGGVIRIQVPDMDTLAHAITGHPGVQCNKCGNVFGLGAHPNATCDQTQGGLVAAAIGRIYGGQDYPGNFHMAGFTKQSMIRALTERGFSGVRFEEIDHQKANWNFKAAARKL